MDDAGASHWVFESRKVNSRVLCGGGRPIVLDEFAIIGVCARVLFFVCCVDGVWRSALGRTAGSHQCAGGTHLLAGADPVPGAVVRVRGDRPVRAEV